jgi:hypothetical protein
VLLDEASMVGNADKEKLVRLANLLELGRFASIGDRKQLGAVDAGKALRCDAAGRHRDGHHEHQSRARRDKACVMLNRQRRAHIEEAMRHLGTPGDRGRANDAAVDAAAAWLSLSPAEREATAIYASGRNLRGR